MHIYVTIASANDAIHFTAIPKENDYVFPCLTFYEIDRDGERMMDSLIKAAWDNPSYIRGELYHQLSDFCNLDSDVAYELSPEVNEVLVASDCDPFELKDIIDKAIKMRMLDEPIEPNPLSVLNNIVGN